ncbi:MAG: fumarate hydratase C-terminal domain-containing protein, partial [Solobacterium sp.]|nr:fumarate hydratase C-terminal domain-containing protein [Solobacterium sp.]
EDVQLAFYRSIPGLEKVQIMRSAYAIEYDCVDPTQMAPTLEFLDLPGLYGAGQFNGSSGYEEAAAQGLVAGINAALKIQNREPLPFEIRDASVYYVGPTPAKPGTAIGSAGPTTSSRMDAYTPELLDLGLRAMIGKGRRSEAVKEAIQRNHAVYFVCCGGAGALLSHAVQEREMLAWPELLSEAVTKLTVKDFPCFVGIDSLGNDIYEMEDEE